MIRPAEQRFWALVEKTDSCWFWTGRKDEDGYGRFAPKRTPMGAHRFAYELLVAPIPEGLQIDHLCFTKDCVNPAHLEPVTGRENTRRALHRRRPDFLTHCSRGHRYTECTTHIRPSDGARQCRTCHAEYMRKWNAARRQSA